MKYCNLREQFPYDPLKSPPKYPGGAAFAVLLRWHLESWGTYAKGNATQNSGPWYLKEFASLVVGNSVNLSYGTAERNLKNWIKEGAAPPKDKPRVIRILEELFGQKECFDQWRNDLIAAWETYYNKPLFDGAGNATQTRNVRLNRTRRDGFEENSSLSLPSSHLGADAKHGVKVVADTLAEHYYGRAADLAMVSAFVDARMAGDEAALLIVTAPAGFGKSALAVNWCNSTDSHPNRCVAIHLCSISSGRATTTLDNIFANLHRQIANVYGAAAPTLKDNDAVTGLLAIAPPSDKQLVLWLDGLDEADELVQCFLPQKLGERVCVIVSARAENKVTPAYIDEWQYGLRAVPHCPHRHPLTKFSQDGVQDLLTGLYLAEGFTPSDGVTKLIYDASKRIYNASEQGYPLFARLMSDDALEAMRRGEEVDLGDVPESLANYVARQFKRLKALAGWRVYQPLFAFLTITREAVRIDELPALIGLRLLPEAMPDQIARWFNLVADDMNNRPPMLSFAHPKLAELFGRALGYQRAEAAQTLCERMVDTAHKKWPLYAWRHMPQHLLENGMIIEAENRLTDLEFIAARMKAVGAVEGPRLFANDWFHWYEISHQEDHHD